MKLSTAILVALVFILWAVSSTVLPAMPVQASNTTPVTLITPTATSTVASATDETVEGFIEGLDYSKKFTGHEPVIPLPKRFWHTRKQDYAYELVDSALRLDGYEIWVWLVHNGWFNDFAVKVPYNPKDKTLQDGTLITCVSKPNATRYGYCSADIIHEDESDSSVWLYDATTGWVLQSPKPPFTFCTDYTMILESPKCKGKVLVFALRGKCFVLPHDPETMKHLTLPGGTNGCAKRVHRTHRNVLAVKGNKR